MLEYFGGNVSLGIASYRQAVKIHSPAGETSRTDFARNSIAVSSSPKRDQETEIPWDGDDCFCFSSHALIGEVNFVVTLDPVIRQHHDTVFFHRQNHSDWQLPPFYRPPRSA